MFKDNLKVSERQQAAPVSGKPNRVLARSSSRRPAWPVRPVLVLLSVLAVLLVCAAARSMAKIEGGGRGGSGEVVREGQ